MSTRSPPQVRIWPSSIVLIHVYWARSRDVASRSRSASNAAAMRGHRVVVPMQLVAWSPTDRSGRDLLQGQEPRLDPRRREPDTASFHRRVLRRRLGQIAPLKTALEASNWAQEGLALVGRRGVQQHVALEERIAAEQLVGTLARHHHLVAALVDPAAHVPLGDAERVVEGAFRVPDDAPVEVAVQVGGPELQHLLIGLRRARHLGGDRRLVVVRVVEADRERLHMGLLHGRRQPEDRTAVDPARQVATDRDVGLEARRTASSSRSRTPST